MSGKIVSCLGIFHHIWEWFAISFWTYLGILCYIWKYCAISWNIVICHILEHCTMSENYMPYVEIMRNIWGTVWHQSLHNYLLHWRSWFGNQTKLNSPELGTTQLKPVPALFFLYLSIEFTRWCPLPLTRKSYPAPIILNPATVIPYGM